jgi:hypothetical protein
LLLSVNAFCASEIVFVWKSYLVIAGNSRSAQAILLNATVPPRSTTSASSIHPDKFWPIAGGSTTFFQTASRPSLPPLKTIAHEPLGGRC